MQRFASADETIAFGGMVVRLFRAVLSRDPGPEELLRYAGRVRASEAPAALAADLLATDEAQHRHGADAPVDHVFVTRTLEAVFGKAVPDSLASMAAAIPAVGRAEFVATLVGMPAVGRRVPLLPGLAPGAPPDDRSAYALWRRLYEAPHPKGPMEADGAPPVAVAMVAGDSEVEAALQSLESLQAQSHADWTLHLVAETRSAWPREALREHAALDSRLVLHEGAASHAIDAALAQAPEGLICGFAPGHRLAEQALAAVAAAFRDNPSMDLLFTDEDAIQDGRRAAPRFRPAWSAWTGAYDDAQLAVVRSRRLRGLDTPLTGRFEPLVARVAMSAPAGAVGHLPQLLFHRVGSVPDPEPARPPGTASPRPAPALPDAPASVAILMPTRDRADLLEACAKGVLSGTDYPSLRLLVMDNGSTDPNTLTLLDRLRADDRVQVLEMPGPFNFAAMNNRAAADCADDLLVLLNNDVEITHASWLAEMVALAMRPEVGAVGARLLYPDGTLQHAGLLLGPDGAATHVGRNAPAADPGYLGRFAEVTELSAVTGACLAIRRSLYRDLGGMDERLAVTWNDVDLCLRVREAGFRVLWTPFATLVHHEAQSRAREDADAASAARFRAEQDLVRARWGDAIDRDPFLNPNLLATEAGALVLTEPRLPCGEIPLAGVVLPPWSQTGRAGPAPRHPA